MDCIASTCVLNKQLVNEAILNIASGLVRIVLLCSLSKQAIYLYFLGTPRRLSFFIIQGFSLHFEYERLVCPARALRALGLLLADGTPTGGRGEDFLSRQPDFFTETAVTPERKVEKSFPRWEINRHDKG